MNRLWFIAAYSAICAAQPADTVVTVSATEERRFVDVEATGTRAVIAYKSLERLPFATDSRGIEAALLSFPGFAADANGAIHPRGAHNQMTYVIDGVPIGDQLTGAFASALDPRMAEHIELFTGDIPAEFGAKVSGVAAIATRSGLGSGRRFFGNSQVNLGSFGVLSNNTQMGGQLGRLGYFASFSTRETKRFLDQVSIENLHNGGNSERVFTRLDYQLTPGDTLHLNLMAGRSSFQLANLRSQQANGQDQRQLLHDYSLAARYLKTVSPRSTFEAIGSWRTNLAELIPSPGDTPVTASQSRRLSTLFTAARVNHELGTHSLRAGIEYQRFPVKEDFAFAVTDPGFSAALPAFHFHARDTGSLASGFAQDRVHWKRFLFSIGARYDTYRFLTDGSQLQPRLGLSYSVQETGTALRISYNRIYQTPVNENLLLSNSALSASRLLIRPERQNVYEAGLQQALWGKAGLNVMYFHKSIRDLHDNDNFFNTGVIFPTSLARANVNGAEMKLTAPPIAHFAGWVSLTHYHVWRRRRLLEGCSWARPRSTRFRAGRL